MDSDRSAFVVVLMSWSSSPVAIGEYVVVFFIPMWQLHQENEYQCASRCILCWSCFNSGLVCFASLLRLSIEVINRVSMCLSGLEG